MSLTIETIFGAHSLQGVPRPGRRCFGVPPGGAFDQQSFLIANRLVGNDSDEPCLELGLGTCTLAAKCSMRMAVVGCAAQVDGQDTPLLTSFDIHKGSNLALSIPFEARSYLAVAAGWRSLVDGFLNPNPSENLPPKFRLQLQPRANNGPFRFMRQESASDSLVEQLFNHPFSVSYKLDRVGIRLSGRTFDCQSGGSEPSSMGVIQATEADAIIHGPDGPTIGGYQKIGCVIRADWNRLAQLKPGDELNFQQVSLEEAKILWVEEQMALKKRLQAISAI